MPFAIALGTFLRDLVGGGTALDDAVARGRVVLYGEQAGLQRLQCLVRKVSGNSGSADPGGGTP